MPRMRLVLSQFNPTVGDIGTNAERITAIVGHARELGADLVLLPELAITGYPPRDLLHQEGFVEAAERAGASLAAHSQGITVIVGCPTGGSAARCYNSLLVFRDGAEIARYHKRLLPTYDIFDEDRYFFPGDEACVIEVAGLRVGLSICEDLWKGADALASWRYEQHDDPVDDLVRAGVDLIVNPSGSPFVIGKGDRQREIVRRHVEERGVALATVNQVGGNDDLIFDGHAAAYVPTSSGARLVGAGPGFQEHDLVVDIPSDRSAWESLEGVPDPRVSASTEELLFRALVLGVHDYCAKTGFSDVVIGLSGGIDSALTCAIAAAALGPEHVLGIGMPSRYSSEGSVSDARDLAERLGVPFHIVPIESAHASVETALAPAFGAIGADPTSGVTEENLQSRIRGLILMAFSNKTGALLLTTGNKSEVAVGYCTLYGDMNGGLAVLSDVTKVDVYAVSRWINANYERFGFERAPIPEPTISKPPSAELKPDQVDQDTLPPYEVLDEVIRRYVERQQSVERIIDETGFENAMVKRVVRMIDVNEYKRKQMPVGLKVSGITFGPGRRMPIAQRYRPDQAVGV